MQEKPLRPARARRRSLPWRRRRRRTLLYLSIPIGLLCVFLGLRLHLKMDLDRRLAAIHAAGYPVTLQELNAWYPEVPETENAAPLYDAALKAYRGIPGAQAKTLPFYGEDTTARNAPYSKEIMTGIVVFLEQNSETLGLLHQAAARPRCRFPADLAQGMATDLSHLTPLREDARLLCLQAVLAAEHREGAQATDALLDAIATGNSLREEPLLISQLTSISAYGMTFSAMERVLSRMPLAKEDLDRLGEALLRSDMHLAARRAYAGERCAGIPAFRGSLCDMSAYPKSSLDQLIPGVSRGLALFRSILGIDDIDLRYTLEMYDVWMAALQLPWPDALRERDRVKKRDSDLPMTFAFKTRMLTPAIGSAMDAFARADALRSAAIAGLAIERYRLQQGELPKRLDDLAPAFIEAVPVDPFDGQPLRYRRLDPGYVVYSIGENRLDDSGEISVSPHGRRRMKDWPFTVER